MGSGSRVGEGLDGRGLAKVVTGTGGDLGVPRRRVGVGAWIWVDGVLSLRRLRLARCIG